MKAAILLGCLEGLLIAMLGVGVVLVYKAERFVNFANAQLGVLSTILLAKLVIDLGVNWYIAFVVAVALGVAVGAACRGLVMSRLENATRTGLMIATLGLSQLLVAASYFEWLGADRERLRLEGYPLPFDVRWMFDGLAVTGRHVLIAVVAPVVLLGLALWLRSSVFGRTVRAAASNPDAARLAGIDVRRTATVVWAIAGGISAVGAVLTSPGQAVLQLQASGPLLLLLGLGAAGLAGFTSLSGAAAAGVGLGVVNGIGIHVGNGTGAGLTAVFVVVLLGLGIRSVLVGSAEADEVRVERSDQPLWVPEPLARRWFVRRRTLLRAGIGTFIGVLLPFLPWVRQPHQTYVLAYVAVLMLAALSLTILSGWAGQLSLGHFALVAIGAFTAARVAPRGWSLLSTMIVAGVAGAVAATVVGLSAARSRGLTFTVTSLGVAVVGPVWLFRQPWLGGEGTTSIDPAYQPGLGRLLTQRSLYFVALAVLIVVGVALTRLRGSNAGRVVVAIRDNATTAATLGFSPVVVRLTTFALSGALAGAAGALWLAVNRNISAGIFDPNQSMVLLSAVVIGGIGSIAGAVLGVMAVFGLPALLAEPLNAILPTFSYQLQLFLSGVGLLTVQIVHPGGIASAPRRAFQRRIDRSGARREPPTAMAVPQRRAAWVGPAPSPRDDAVALSVRDVRVSFGGVVAVDDVALEVAPGEIVGVIGANGAGKTTLLNAICGLVPAGGTVEVYGRAAAGLSPARRAQLGMSRGFQDARLFPALTVRETIELALDRRYPTGLLGSLVGVPWVRLAERTLVAEADGIIERFGLVDFADLPGDRLSTGTRHVCDLAAQAATRPRLMILDEPTSGIAQRETEAFRPVIRDLTEELGCAMLVVEHDMPFLMAVADRIYCLDRGRVIAEGTPAAVRKDPAVVASYLGAAGTRRVNRARPRRAPAKAARGK